MGRVSSMATACWMSAIGSIAAVDAAEIRVLSLPPLRSAMTDVLPQFEQSSGHRVAIEYGTPGVLAERLGRGEHPDVLIHTAEGIASFQQKGMIAAGSQVNMARVGMGVLVRAGARKPDIGSVDAFKQSLRAAESIAYIDPASGAPGGIYLARLFERLGIAADLKSKTRHFGPSGAEAAVAKGEIELGLSQITVIMASPGVDLVGPLPSEIQNYLQFTGAITTGSNHPEASDSFVRFMLSPAAQAVMKARGFE